MQPPADTEKVTKYFLKQQMTRFSLLQRLKRNRVKKEENMRKGSVLNLMKDGQIKLKDG